MFYITLKSQQRVEIDALSIERSSALEGLVVITVNLFALRYGERY